MRRNKGNINSALAKIEKIVTELTCNEPKTPAKRPRAPKMNTTNVSAETFEDRFNREFDRLRKVNRLNLVELSALRERMPQYSREEFDNGLFKMRMGDKYVLQVFDGRHGALTEKEKAGMIKEWGYNYAYATKKE